MHWGVNERERERERKREALRPARHLVGAVVWEALGLPVVEGEAVAVKLAVLVRLAVRAVLNGKK